MTKARLLLEADCSRDHFNLLLSDYTPIKQNRFIEIMFNNNQIQIKYGDRIIKGKRIDDISKWSSFGLIGTKNKVLAYYQLDDYFGGAYLKMYENNWIEYTVLGSGRPIINSSLYKIENKVN